VRASTHAPFPPSVIFATLWKHEEYVEFVPYLKRLEILRQAAQENVIYEQIKMPPLVSDRDYTVKNHGGTRCQERRNPDSLRDCLIHAAANFASFFASRELSINESIFCRIVWKEQILFRRVALTLAMLVNRRLWVARRRSTRQKRSITPIVLVNVSPDSPAMQEEIFGPILPVLEVNDAQEVIAFANARPCPRGLYLFSEDQSVTEQLLNSTTSGDAAVNECTL
jgi:hypothetical protein